MRFGGAHVCARLIGAGPQPALPRAQRPASHPPTGLEPAWLPLWPTVWAGTPSPEDTGRAPGTGAQGRGVAAEVTEVSPHWVQKADPRQGPRPPPSARALAGASSG